ncbi:hypothetical protein EJ03DRAFT_35512 [Teratosphaeria nubilosa]|uniref:Uncharacterized protein n=1 Tax=Teratosphaeria nubilosa TaxID=161662 RepID=A0A6G1KU70_9PEZI|nr:hypothetical protein EJ03DRAFT_35512 [Teratosphaeria nubilosa]
MCVWQVSNIGNHLIGRGDACPAPSTHQGPVQEDLGDSSAYVPCNGPSTDVSSRHLKKDISSVVPALASKTQSSQFHPQLHHRQESPPTLFKPKPGAEKPPSPHPHARREQIPVGHHTPHYPAPTSRSSPSACQKKSQASSHHLSSPLLSSQPGQDERHDPFSSFS